MITADRRCCDCDGGGVDDNRLHTGTAAMINKSFAIATATAANVRQRIVASRDTARLFGSVIPHVWLLGCDGVELTPNACSIFPIYCIVKGN
jgi:hypothetical protein